MGELGFQIAELEFSVVDSGLSVTLQMFVFRHGSHLGELILTDF